jgi:3-oxoacyl-[acyl-carrier protein] reductase
MDLEIAGKVAFVSGGSKGIGRATAERLAAEGAQVIVAATGKDSIDAAVAAIRSRGGQAVGVVADLTVRKEIEHAVRQGSDCFGPPDIVIFNGLSPRSSGLHGPAGAERYASVHGDFFDVTDEQLADVARGVYTVSCLTRAVVPHMIKNKWGRLINIGTAAPKEPPPDLPHILASTGAASVVALQKTLSNELGPHGITVNYLALGFVGTANMYDYVDLLAQQQKISRDEALEKWTSQIPLRRVGRPEEVASTVAFLCSAAAGYITGQFIGIHGGILRSAF